MKPQYIEIDKDGNKFYYSNKAMTISHREDGPAYEYVTTGLNIWYLNGKCHREDGPACEYSNGNKLWYLSGENITEEEHAAHFSLPGKKTIKPNLEKKTNNG